MPGPCWGGYYCPKARKQVRAKSEAKDTIKHKSTHITAHLMPSPTPSLWVEASILIMASKTLHDLATIPPLPLSSLLPTNIHCTLCTVAWRGDDAVPPAWKSMASAWKLGQSPTALTAGSCQITALPGAEQQVPSSRGIQVLCSMAARVIFQEVFTITSPQCSNDVWAGCPNHVLPQHPARSLSVPVLIHLSLSPPGQRTETVLISFTILSPTLTRAWNIEDTQQMAVKWKYKWINDTSCLHSLNLLRN